MLCLCEVRDWSAVDAAALRHVDASGVALDERMSTSCAHVHPADAARSVECEQRQQQRRRDALVRISSARRVAQSARVLASDALYDNGRKVNTSSSARHRRHRRFVAKPRYDDGNDDWHECRVATVSRVCDFIGVVCLESVQTAIRTGLTKKNNNMKTRYVCVVEANESHRFRMMFFIASMSSRSC